MLEEWSGSTGMVINRKKSGVLVIQPRGVKRRQVEMPYWLDYEVVEVYKYLGVELSEDGGAD